MHKSLEKLVQLGSEPLVPGKLALEFSNSTISESNLNELNEMYSYKNGFFAFESALYVFPVQSFLEHIGSVDWNLSETWKFAYNGEADNLFSFSEDIFGNQFCFFKNEIARFECETGRTTFFAASLGEWAKLILEDYDFLTGNGFARSWQIANGKLEGRRRLFPKQPFTMGGSFDTGNLVSMNGDKVLRFFGEFASQIRKLPDGSDVRLVVDP